MTQDKAETNKQLIHGTSSNKGSPSKMLRWVRSMSLWGNSLLAKSLQNTTVQHDYMSQNKNIFPKKNKKPISQLYYKYNEWTKLCILCTLHDNLEAVLNSKNKREFNIQKYRCG